MRLIPIECVRENSLLGKDIYTPDGRCLLRAGILLNDTMLQKLRNIKYSLYI